MIRSFRLAFLLAALVSWFSIPVARAGTLLLPDSLFSEALSESVATAFEPRSSTDVARLELEDFRLEWQGPAIPDTEFSFAPQSLEWVRASDTIVFPRARLQVRVKSAERALIENVKHAQPFLPETDGALGAEISVLLFSGPKNAVRVTVTREGREATGTLIVRYEPRVSERANPIFIDAGCSADRVNAIWKSPPAKPSWAYVGCRLVHAKTGGPRTSTLEVYLLWDATGSRIRVSGTPVEETRSGLWLLRLRPHQSSANAPVVLTSDEGAIELTHSAPVQIRYGSLGVGVGPYRYTLQTPNLDVNTTAAITTLYASYSLTDTSRLTAFNATALHRHFFTDMGFYFNSESVRTLDRRFSLNVMLGANAIGFRTNGTTRFKVGAPQGFEATYRDAFGRRWSLSAGAFIYPKINEKSYYNLWVRYGTGGKFLEINYISIHDELGGHPVYTRSIGLCYGMPLFRFL